MDVYLDTNLWNALCDQAVDPGRLIQRLADKKARLILGLHNFYECAKTFRSSTTPSVQRGRRLFAYLKGYVNFEVECVKENPELLAAEMWAAKQRTEVVETLLSREDCARVLDEAERLERGEVTEQAQKFLRERVVSAASTRKALIRHLKDHDVAKRQLKRVSTAKLESFLDVVGTSAAGIKLLAGHVLGRFSEDATDRDAVEYAIALLNPPPRRFARGVVRADLYNIWRCAHRDSIPADLNDDLYHVLNAVYCDIYATAERGQAEYAPLILTRSTSVAIYDGQRRIDDWLEDLASRSRVHSA